jgi:hypothetical protein
MTSHQDGSLRSYGASGSNSTRTLIARSVCRLAPNAGWLTSWGLQCACCKPREAWLQRRPMPAPLIRQSLDEFLLGSVDLYPGPVISAVHAVARRTGRSGPAMTAWDIAAYLQARGMPAFGKRMLADLDQPGHA